MWKGVDMQKTKILIHEEVKKQLIESMVISNVAEPPELSKKAEIQRSEHAAAVIRQYEDITRTK